MLTKKLYQPKYCLKTSFTDAVYENWTYRYLETIGYWWSDTVFNSSMLPFSYNNFSPIKDIRTNIRYIKRLWKKKWQTSFWEFQFLINWKIPRKKEVLYFLLNLVLNLDEKYVNDSKVKIEGFIILLKTILCISTTKSVQTKMN